MSFPEGRVFRTWQFDVGHGELFVRSLASAEHPRNIDLYFNAVRVMSLRAAWFRMVVRHATTGEIDRIEEFAGPQEPARRLYLVFGDHLSDGFVNCANFSACENDLTFRDNPRGRHGARDNSVQLASAP